MKYIKQYCFDDIRFRLGCRRFRIRCGSIAWWTAAFLMCVCTGYFLLSLPTLFLLMFA